MGDTRSVDYGSCASQCLWFETKAARFTPAGFSGFGNSGDRARHAMQAAFSV